MGSPTLFIILVKLLWGGVLALCYRFPVFIPLKAENHLI
jgi:hypothetical protein